MMARRMDGGAERGFKAPISRRAFLGVKVFGWEINARSETAVPGRDRPRKRATAGLRGLAGLRMRAGVPARNYRKHPRGAVAPEGRLTGGVSGDSFAAMHSGRRLLSSILLQISVVTAPAAQIILVPSANTSL